MQKMESQACPWNSLPQNHVQSPTGASQGSLQNRTAGAGQQACSGVEGWGKGDGKRAGEGREREETVVLCPALFVGSPAEVLDPTSIVTFNSGVSLVRSETLIVSGTW